LIRKWVENGDLLSVRRGSTSDATNRPGAESDGRIAGLDQCQGPVVVQLPEKLKLSELHLISTPGSLVILLRYHFQVVCDLVAKSATKERYQERHNLTNE
jgi:hypothetical protein